MSVIVKGMQMPDSCLECMNSGFRTAVKCAEWTEISAGRRGNERAWSCPLVELPEKHGDLIDRTTLLKEFELAQKSADMHGREFANAFYSSGNEISTEWWAVEELVENAIAVIEAEGGACTM